MKIGIIGCGHVGSASAYACVMRGIGTQITMADINADLATAQAEDILHATPFADAIPLSAGEIADLSGSGIVMLAAGANQKPGETRLDLLKRNTDIFNKIVPEIIKSAPDAIILVATNPVDVITHMVSDFATKSGHDRRRVIGSGTILDTARFRTLLAGHLGVSSHSVHANVLGEHGDSEVLHWSKAQISNMAITDFAAQAASPVTSEIRAHIDNGVRKAAYKIIKGKGATWYGIGAGMARIAKAIVDDEHAVLTCSSRHHDVEGIKNVTLSLPSLVGANGIEKTFYPQMDKSEHEALRNSAQIIRNALASIGL